MEFGKGMAETVAEHMPSAAEIAACEWLPDVELRVYSAEYRRTGFQGGLQWYRSVTSVTSIFAGGINADLQVFAGTHDRPAVTLHCRHERLGHSPAPGRARADGDERLHRHAGCAPARRGGALAVQQEQSAAVSRLVVEFLGAL